MILSLVVRLYVNTSIKTSRDSQYKSPGLPSYTVKLVDTLSITSFVLYSEGTVPSSIHSFAFTTVIFSRLSSLFVSRSLPPVGKMKTFYLSLWALAGSASAYLATTTVSLSRREDG